MGKNHFGDKKRLKKKKNVQTMGPGPQHGMAAPPPPRPPPPPHGGFRGPAPVRPIGPPGQRFPGPYRDFGPQNPRMMMMDNMEGDRRFMHETQGLMMHNEPFRSMNFPDRHEFHHQAFDGPDPRFQNHSEFGNNPEFGNHPQFGNHPPGPRFYRPELDCAPRFRSPEFCDRPPDFCPPEFNNDRRPDFCPPEFNDRRPDFCPPEFQGRPSNFHPSEYEGGPGFHGMNPGFNQMEQYGPRDPHFVPQMDAHVSFWGPHLSSDVFVLSRGPITSQ